MLLFLNQIFQIFEFRFAQIALVSTLFVTLTCGMLSPVVVLKQRSYLGDALSHLIFPGIVFGFLLAQYSELPFWACVFSGAFVTALLGTFLSEWVLKTLKIPPDASAVMCLSAFFAWGALIISSHPNTNIHPESLFFGDILTLTWTDATILGFVFIFVTFSIFLLQRHWDAWLSDPEFAKIMGFHVKLLDRLFPVLMTCVILSGIFAVGGLMISALLTLPTILYQPRSVFSFPVIFISFLGGIFGILTAFAINWPVGPTIVVIGFVSVLIKTGILSMQEKKRI
jgi:ABC-type Mn2+/Zn2+ transport system permease subunit